MNQNDLSSAGYEKEVREVESASTQSRLGSLGLLCKTLISEHNAGLIGVQKVGYIVYGLSANFSGNNNITGLTHLFYLAGLLELPEMQMPKASVEIWSEFESQAEKVWCPPSFRTTENTKS